jgi:glycerol-3-phosphate cytidylyltransferase
MQARRGLATGVFDLFHVGHLRYLQYARGRCGALVVAVTPDRIVETAKGRKPIVPEEQRLELIRGLGIVAEASLLPETLEATEAAALWITDWRIQHVICGGGWQGTARWERLLPRLESSGITVEFAPYSEEVSTTQLLETIRHRPD